MRALTSKGIWELTALPLVKDMVERTRVFVIKILFDSIITRDHVFKIQ